MHKTCQNTAPRPGLNEANLLGSWTVLGERVHPANWLAMLPTNQDNMHSQGVFHSSASIKASVIPADSQKRPCKY